MKKLRILTIVGLGLACQAQAGLWQNIRQDASFLQEATTSKLLSIKKGTSQAVTPPRIAAVALAGSVLAASAAVVTSGVTTYAARPSINGLVAYFYRSNNYNSLISLPVSVFQGLASRPVLSFIEQLYGEVTPETISSYDKANKYLAGSLLGISCTAFVYKKIKEYRNDHND